jgi:hypothetical protein
MPPTLNRLIIFRYCGRSTPPNTPCRRPKQAQQVKPQHKVSKPAEAPGSPTIGQTSGWFGKMAIMPLRRWRYGLPGACEHW